MIILQVTPDELKQMIHEAVRRSMPTSLNEAAPQPFIKGIHELAKFLRVSPVRAQKLKNEGVFPYWQDGRTLLFDPEQVRSVMENKKA